MGMAAELSLSYAAIESGCWASEQVYLLSSIVCVLFCLVKPFFFFSLYHHPKPPEANGCPSPSLVLPLSSVKMEFLPTATQCLLHRVVPCGVFSLTL